MSSRLGTGNSLTLFYSVVSKSIVHKFQTFVAVYNSMILLCSVIPCCDDRVPESDPHVVTPCCQHAQLGAMRRKIRLVEDNAKGSHLKKLTCKRTFCGRCLSV